MSFSATSHWRRSTYSNSNNNCVEIAILDSGHVVVRDSKNEYGVVLAFTPAEWAAFIQGVLDGQFNNTHGFRGRRSLLKRPPRRPRWLRRALRGRTRPAGLPDA
jgi:hypothetical protein